MKMNKTLLLGVIGLVGIGVGWYYLGRPSLDTKIDGTAIKRIKERGVLIMGTDPTYPPMESMEEGEKAIGFDIDMGREIADSIGVDLEIKTYTWDEVFIGLEKGEVDIVLSAVTITPERLSQWLFSDPYFNAGQVLVGKRGIEGIESVKDIGERKMGVLVDTTSYDEAVKYGQLKNISTYNTFDQVVSGLMAGKFELTIADLPVAVELIKNEKELMIYGEPVTEEFYGVVARKGEEDLIQRVNTTISKLKRSGELSSLIRKWISE